MKLATILSAVLILGGVLSAARADTWVFRDTLRPKGQDRSMAAKRTDGRKCGLTRQNTFSHGDAFVRCMQAYGWAFDHIVPDQSARYLDPDSGMSCQNIGGVAICDPPARHREILRSRSRAQLHPHRTGVHLLEFLGSINSDTSAGSTDVPQSKSGHDPKA